MSMLTKTSYPFLLTASQVAEILNTSKSFAYALMNKGEIPVVRLGKSVRVRQEDLEEYILSNVDKGSNGKAAW
jgi:excisionase family DNA binding protein